MRMSAIGTKRTSRDVRYLTAFGGKADRRWLGVVVVILSGQQDSPSQLTVIGAWLSLKPTMCCVCMLIFLYLGSPVTSFPIQPGRSNF